MINIYMKTDFIPPSHVAQINDTLNFSIPWKNLSLSTSSDTYSVSDESLYTISGLWMGGFFICLSISMLLLYKATQTLPIGTAYAVWTGIGAVGTVLVGIFIFKEPATFWRIFFLTTLIGSIVGLKFVSN